MECGIMKDIDRALNEIRDEAKRTNKDCPYCIKGNAGKVAKCMWERPCTIEESKNFTSCTIFRNHIHVQIHRETDPLIDSLGTNPRTANFLSVLAKKNSVTTCVEVENGQIAEQLSKMVSPFYDINKNQYIISPDFAITQLPGGILNPQKKRLWYSGNLTEKILENIHRAAKKVNGKIIGIDGPKEEEKTYDKLRKRFKIIREDFDYELDKIHLYALKRFL